MKKIIDWFKESNRGLHLLLGVVVGLLPTGWWNTEVLAAGVAGGMEFKDWQWRAHGAHQTLLTSYLLWLVSISAIY